MDYSFASYLLPAIAPKNKRLSCRVKFAGQHLDFQHGHMGYEVKTNKGLLLRKEQQGSYKTGFTTTKPDPMIGPISEVLQKHCGLDPTTVKLDDFQVVELVEQKKEYNPQTYPYYDYNRPPVYQEGDTVPVDWSSPWNITGQTVDVLKEMCENNRDTLRAVIAEIQQSWQFGGFSKLETGCWRRPRHMQLKAPGKPLSPRCVFLKGGAIFDYKAYKTVASNLDVWISEYLGLQSAADVTWDMIYNHLVVSHVGLPTALASAKIKKESLEQRKVAEYWRLVDSKVRATMPFLSTSKARLANDRTGRMQFFALNKTTGKAETYTLGAYGIHRNYDLAPFPEKPTDDQRQQYIDWRRPMSRADALTLASDTNRAWFAQVNTKWSSSQFEPVDLLSCL